jgi:hypothetical protein
MHPLDGFARAQHRGLATWSDLRAAGVDSSALASAVSDGLLARPHRGVYTDGTASGPLAARAAAASVCGTVCGGTAALVHGLAVVRPGSVPCVAVARRRSRVRRRGVRVCRVDLAADEIVTVDGVPVTAPLRTVLDCARDLPTDEALAVADSALRLGLVTETELRRAAARLRGPGATAAREVAALSDARAESPLESLLRALLDRHGLTPDALQHEVWHHGRLAGRVDLWYADAALAVEADGFTYHADRSSYRRDRRRANALHLAGVAVLRFSWEDVVHDPDHVVATVRRALGR